MSGCSLYHHDLNMSRMKKQKNRKETEALSTEALSIDSYLKKSLKNSHPVFCIIHAGCDCGNIQFQVRADDVEGCVQRICKECGRKKWMLDSDKVVEEAELTTHKCLCKENIFEIAVAFSVRKDNSIKWVTFGIRCSFCGMLDILTDWKINYAPAGHLYKNV